jgi:hypothetical protein
MIDLIFTLSTLAFFGIALVYTSGCERLRRGKSKGKIDA